MFKLNQQCRQGWIQIGGLDFGQNKTVKLDHCGFYFEKTTGILGILQ